MKWVLTLLFISFAAHAETSKVIPAFLEAVEIYGTSAENQHILKPEIRAILEILQKKSISTNILEKFKTAKKSWPLPDDDYYDRMILRNRVPSPQNVPEVSLHISKIDVINASEYSDDIYAYFFITDGVIPTGKVTSIYKDVAPGQGFFFNAIDRAIFPLIGIPAKAPTNHLIIDYGIVESDGDDIKKLQQLSSIIIDIAIAVYSSRNPQSGQIIINLRKEIKALADLLISFNSDDRLITDSFAFTTQEITELLKVRTFVDFKKNHKKIGNYSNWEYDIHFRLLR